MKKSTIITLLVIALLMLSIPLIYYISIFGSYEYSKDISDWADFGSYLNGTFMPLIALTGIIVTLILGVISNKRDKSKIELEQQKQRPLLHVGYLDAQNKIQIFMQNKGNGPLIIDKYRLVNIKTSDEKEGIFDCLPKISYHFNNYTGNQENTVLDPEEKQELLLYQITQKNSDQEIENYSDDRELVRAELGKYKIVINYKDVYNVSMPQYERSLKWFRRNIK